MTNKLTEWYPAEIKPVRVGPYDRRAKADENHDPLGRGLWTGGSWIFIETGWPCGIQDCEWRGLAEEPK